jgi:hypothetical protein
MLLPGRNYFPLITLAMLTAGAIGQPVAAYDLQYRQNNTNFSAADLQRIFNSGLPAAYDQAFPEHRWSTYLLLDSHPNKGQVAITLGLSPRIGPSKALLPIATYSVIEPIPGNGQQWQTLLSNLARAFANTVLSNREGLINQR